MGMDLPTMKAPPIAKNLISQQRFKNGMVVHTIRVYDLSYGTDPFEISKIASKSFFIGPNGKLGVSHGPNLSSTSPAEGLKVDDAVRTTGCTF